MIFETDDRVPLTVGVVLEAITSLRRQGLNPLILRVTEDQRQEIRDDARRALLNVRPVVPELEDEVAGTRIVVTDEELADAQRQVAATKAWRQPLR